MGGGLYSLGNKNFDKTLDLSRIKPYGDTMNDGKVQISFTLPVDDGEKAMSEEPQLPMIPAIGDVLGRKDRVFQKNTTVVKCKNCHAKYSREFKVGDYIFKKLTDEQCNKCNKKDSLEIGEIYSEWIDPKKPSIQEDDL